MSSKKTINILGGRDYRLPGGLEIYYYAMAEANPEIEFIYWITTKKQENTEFVRDEIQNMSQRQFFSKKISNNVLLHRFKKIKQYCFWMSNRKNEIWWITNEFAPIFLIKRKFFRKNQVFLFQHQTLKESGFIKGISGLLTKVCKKLGIFKSKLNFVKEMYFANEIDEKNYKRIVFSQLRDNQWKYGVVLENFNNKNNKNKTRQNDLIFIGRTYFKAKRFDKFLNLINRKEFKNKKIIVVGENNIKGTTSYRYLRHDLVLEKLCDTKFLITTSSDEGQAGVLWEAIQMNTQVILFGTAEIFKIFKQYKGFHFAESESDVVKIINNYRFEEVSRSFNQFVYKYKFTSNFGIKAPTLSKIKYEPKAKLK